MKDLEMKRPSDIMQLGPKSTNKCSYEKKAERDLSEKEEYGG